MIAKVAEALALRKAFPYDPERREGIGADVYTADEMAQADKPEPAPQPTARERIVQRAAAIVEPTPDPMPPDVIVDDFTDQDLAEFNEPPPGLSMDDFRTLVNSGQPRVTRQAIASALFADCGVEVMPGAVAKAVEELTDQQRAKLADGLRLRG